jgi:hypothetical protein
VGLPHQAKENPGNWSKQNHWTFFSNILPSFALFLAEGLSFLVILRTTTCTPAYKTVEK